jgi:hypothetical protein
MLSPKTCILCQTLFESYPQQVRLRHNKILIVLSIRSENYVENKLNLMCEPQVKSQRLSSQMLVLLQSRGKLLLTPEAFV